MRLFSTTTCLCTAVAACSVLAGCASDDDAPPRAKPTFSSEIVSDSDWNGEVAMVRDGDAIWIARFARLDRLDARTGEIRTVAGQEWSRCPVDARVRWSDSAFDFDYPAMVVVGATVFLADERCGFWSFDTATGKRRMLTADTPDLHGDVLWNGKSGPRWARSFGMAMARDGEGLVGCLTVNRSFDPAARADARERVELWAIGLDGTARERIASFDEARARIFCSTVVVDDSSYLVGTDEAVVRVDRKTRAVTTIATGLGVGPWGLAQDATHVFYIGRDAEIVRVARAGGPGVVLRPPLRVSDPWRQRLMIDGDHVYFYEGYALKRMTTSGADVVDFVPGSEDDVTFPTSLGFTDDHVYFEKAAPVEEHEEVIPETGEAIDVKVTFTLRRARKS